MTLKYPKYKASTVKISTIKEICIQQWPNVKVLTLGSSEYACNIDAEGCFYMSQANWPLLEELNLRNTDMGDEGCKFISQAYWPRLRRLNMGRHQNGKSYIGDKGCEWISKGKWSDLTYLNM